MKQFLTKSLFQAKETMLCSNHKTCPKFTSQLYVRMNINFQAKISRACLVQHITKLTVFKNKRVRRVINYIEIKGMLILLHKLLIQSCVC